MVEYVQSYMAQWLVVAGAPYHFVTNRKARGHSFPAPHSEGLEDAKVDTWATFLVLTQAKWTVATLESDFSKLPTAHGGGRYHAMWSRKANKKFACEGMQERKNHSVKT